MILYLKKPFFCIKFFFICNIFFTEIILKKIKKFNKKIIPINKIRYFNIF